MKIQIQLELTLKEAELLAKVLDWEMDRTDENEPVHKVCEKVYNILDEHITVINLKVKSSQYEKNKY